MKSTTGSSRSEIAHDVHSWGVMIGVAGFLVTISQVAIAQGASTYEPSSRVRLRAETCMKDEVDQGAMCVKRCDPDFKLEENGKKLICRANKSGAVQKASQAEYQPPPVPNAPPTKGN